MYDQYDTIIYPSIPKSKMEEAKSWGKKLQQAGSSMWSSFKGLLGGSSPSDSTSSETKETEATQLIPEDVFPVPDMGDTRKKCLEVYMTEYLDVFRSGCVGMSTDLDHLFRCVDHIYGCLYAPWIHDGTPRRGDRMREWKCGNLKEVSTITNIIYVEYM